ncbi:hypothetical protein GALMADRAFT_1353274 [Galerina marginata CBS 339.88]|uniref:Uncharacterized protein n=1 Tax=Galerina marginata (strain CBS 339.88) TaxID=685588 RepID=A0A067SQ01_GALM3|nr:hypothetical protein GALMADRAFT_1353274 [Galerina marginata CBS 339.88]
MSVVAQFLQGVNIAGAPPSKDQLASAHNTLKDALEKDVNLRQRIRQDLADLGSNAVRVQENFSTVQGVVNELDGRDMLQNNEKFGARWEELHRRYSVALGQSKASITELHNKIHEFVYVLLPMVESDDPNMQAIRMKRLEDYVEIIMAFHEPAEQRGNEFLYLKQDVVAFHGNLDTALPNSDNQLHNQRDSLNSDISNREREIADLRRQYDQCRDDDNIFSFFAELVTNDNENRRNDINRQIQGKMDQINGNRQQLDRLEGNEECMHRIMELLKNHTSWFDETTQKLSGMEGIWRMLTSDATALQTRLKGMEKEDDSDMFDLRARSVRPVYEALESALEAYISAVDPKRQNWADGVPAITVAGKKRGTVYTAAYPYYHDQTQPVCVVTPFRSGSLLPRPTYLCKSEAHFVSYIKTLLGYSRQANFWRQGRSPEAKEETEV